MTTFPHKWKALHVGDMVISRAPFHKIQRHIDAAARGGWIFTAAPHPDGYLISCQKAPEKARAA